METDIAVLVIDMQENFLRSLDRQKADSLIKNQIEFLSYSENYDLPVYLIENQEGESTINELLHFGHENIRKPETDSFYNTGLSDKLKEINTIIPMGLYATECVKDTAETAMGKYDVLTAVSLISDRKPNFGEWYKEKGILCKDNFELMYKLNEKVFEKITRNIY
ncbi:MAG: isochorismatase family protein [Nanobdellota archaeon]